MTQSIPAREALFWNKPNVWYPEGLEVCPFCGDTAVAYRKEAEDASRDQTEDGWWYHIGCNSHACVVNPHTDRRPSPELAVAAWNRRASTEALGCLLDRGLAYYEAARVKSAAQREHKASGERRAPGQRRRVDRLPEETIGCDSCGDILEHNEKFPGYVKPCAACQRVAEALAVENAHTSRRSDG